MYIHIYICIVLRWCGLGCFMRKVGFTMSRGDWYFLRAETCWDGVRLYLLGICAARSCAFPASIWRWHKSGTVSRNRNYERKWTKMKENERKQEKEIQRDAMRLCLWILYISFIVVSDVVIAVCQGQHSLKWSRLHMTWHCSVWFYNVLYGSYVFADVLSYASSLLIRYAVEAGPATTWVSLAARVWTRNIGLQFCKMKRARIALG